LLPTNSITLNGSGSNGAIASYRWKKLTGGAATITDSTAVTTTVTGLVSGHYTFQLKVTDSAGNPAIAYDTMALYVNQKPTANIAGNPITITLPVDSVSLNGSGSTDDDGIQSYAWTKVSGPGSPNIVSQNSSTTKVKGLSAGVYVFQLLVTDWANVKDSAQVTVNVLSLHANAGADQYILLPTNSITLNGNGSTGAIASYRWKKLTGGAATITDSTAVTTTVTGLVNGHYTFQLKVTDSSSNTAYDTMALYVNQKPTANIAGNPITITLPVDSVLLNGSGSTDDDGIQSYAWSKVSGPGSPTIVSQNTSTTKVKGLSAGVYVFQLLVTDWAGAKDSAQVTVNVNASGGRLAANLPDITLTVNDSTVSAVKLRIYPNPGHSQTTVTYFSNDNSTKTLNLYTANGVLKAKYAWPVKKGNNIFQLKNISAFSNGWYIIDIRDSNGKSAGKLQFIKM